MVDCEGVRVRRIVEVSDSVASFCKVFVTSIARWLVAVGSFLENVRINMRYRVCVESCKFYLVLLITQTLVRTATQTATQTLTPTQAASSSRTVGQTSSKSITETRTRTQTPCLSTTVSVCVASS